MSTPKNNITGDSLISKPTTDAYSDGWDRIFGKKEKIIVSDTPSSDDHGELKEDLNSSHN